MKRRILILLPFLVLPALLGGCGKPAAADIVRPAASPEPSATTAPADIASSVASPESNATMAPANSTDDWKTFENDEYGLTFRYPPTWWMSFSSGQAGGSEDRSIEVMIGSDLPTTDATDRPIYPDGAYLIEIILLENPAHTMTALAEENRLFQGYRALSPLGDSESVQVKKGYFIRNGPIQVGDFQGLDFIETLPADAQAEIWWTHNAVLVDSANRVLIINATPHPGATTPENWRDMYRAEDARYLETFRKVFLSINVAL